MQEFSLYENNKIGRAIAFMMRAHHGQMYGDMPYFMHPLQVAERIENPTVNEYIAALLHDVVEDTDHTIEDIAELFGDEIAAMVGLLTKNTRMQYKENIQRIIDSKNVGAMKVKLADNLINVNGDKSQMTFERRSKLNTRYVMSIVMLSEALK